MITSLVNTTTFIMLIYGFISLIYVGISIFIIYKSNKELTRGYIRRFFTIFSLVLAVSFFYALWNILLRLNIVNYYNEYILIMDNISLLIFFMLLSYSSFLATIITKKFGFKTLGNKVSQIAQSKIKK